MQDAAPFAATATTDVGRTALAKASWRLLPFVLLLYVVAWFDRVNIGAAALQMNKDLGFSDAVYGFGAGVFFVGYALCEVPSNLILARIGARIWIARIMITWGVLSVAMMYVHGPWTFYIVRFLLGAAEAGFLPGVLYYLGQWFPSAERARAVSWFMLAIPLSSVVGNPLAGLLLELNGWHGLTGWQWLFLIEGAPAVILGVVVLFYLTDTPEQARWLAPEQRRWLAQRIGAERNAAEKRHGVGLGEALLHPTVWLLALVLFAGQTGSYGLQLWIPQMVKSVSGLGNLASTMLSAVPYIAASIGMVVIGARSDRTGERFLHLAIPTAVGAVAFIAIAFVTSPLLSLGLLAVAAVGNTSTRGPFWALPTRFLTGTAAAGGIALINTVASLGGLVGPYAIGLLRTWTGGFGAGLAFLGVLMLIGAGVTLMLRNAPALADHRD